MSYEFIISNTILQVIIFTAGFFIGRNSNRQKYYIAGKRVSKKEFEDFEQYLPEKYRDKK